MIRTTYWITFFKVGKTTTEHHLFFWPPFSLWLIIKAYPLPVSPGPCSLFSPNLTIMSNLYLPLCIQKLTSTIHSFLVFFMVWLWDSNELKCKVLKTVASTKQSISIFYYKVCKSRQWHVPCQGLLLGHLQDAIFKVLKISITK